MRCGAGRAGDTRNETADKSLVRALITRSLSFNIAVSFLIIPDICRTGRRQPRNSSCTPNIRNTIFEFLPYITSVNSRILWGTINTRLEIPAGRLRVDPLPEEEGQMPACTGYSRGPEALSWPLPPPPTHGQAVRSGRPGRGASNPVTCP